MNKAAIAVLVSGGGTNLQALLDAQTSGALTSGEIRLVVSDRAGVYALQRAKRHGVAGEILPKENYPDAHLFGQDLARLLEQYQIDLIVLAGFLSILDECFVQKYPHRILNIHPSLIPAFCGKGYYGLKVHEEALKRGVKISGATVHYVNDIPDGGEILLQKAVSVQPGDTPASLQKRIMEEAEWVLLPQAVEMVSAKIIKREEGK